LRRYLSLAGDEACVRVLGATAGVGAGSDRGASSALARLSSTAGGEPSVVSALAPLPSRPGGPVSIVDALAALDRHARWWCRDGGAPAGGGVVLHQHQRRPARVHHGRGA